jgi:exodeoxyribonuclease V alpha subunit
MEEIYGYVESIVFYEEERGFTVARMKEPRKRELTCIVGTMPSLQPGESLRCRGTWKHHPQYGVQFEVSSFDFEAPSDLLGIQKYLESGMIKGIGPVYAQRIVNHFGTETLQIIDDTPERLHEVQGIGSKRVEMILGCWQQQKSIRQVMIFLRSHGVSPAYANKIFRAYGESSIEKVKANPFALAKEIFGIGFKMADSIAGNLGIAKNAPIRIDAGIEHVLWELTNDGHVCYPRQEFLPQAQKILELEPEEIEGRLRELIKNGLVQNEGEFIWVKALYLSELGITREIGRLMRAPLETLRTVDEGKAIVWVQEELKLVLAPEQKEAVARGIREKLLIITGGPGTGKSTITKAILTISEKITKKILLAAPTGRAAKRMTEITGKKAFTIHSLLEMDFQVKSFKRNRDHPLDCDLIIIDEASMIDTLLMHHLLKAIPSHARVIFIGDIDQLPSVGPGTVLKDMIQSKQLLVSELKQIFRQAAGSQIILNAHRINQGEFPDLKTDSKSDFFFIRAESPEEIAETIVNLVKIRLPKRYRLHRFEDIQVLSPMKRGMIGTENLNILLQNQLNPNPSPLVRMGRTFHMGDKVMQIRNNYQKHVYNGDVGKIVEIDLSEQNLKVLFDDRTVNYEFSEIDELLLAYAVSIHKYQGSECLCIIIPIHTSHFKLLFRNLLYTGITRGKKLVILVGSPKALAIAVKNEETRKRHTGLTKALSSLTG